MDFNRQFEKAFWILVSIVGVVLSWTAVNVADKVDDMSKSVVELNVTIKQVVNQIDSNNLKLLDHEKRIYKLEIKEK